MSAERHITPRVLARLRDEHAKLTDPHVSFDKCQLVLRQLARWARRVDPDDDGHWRANDSVDQLATGLGWIDADGHPRRRAIKYALDALTAAGLLVTVTHGGGTGVAARGSVRDLILDPVDNVGTGARSVRQWDAELGHESASTRARTDRTGARQRAHSVYSSVYSSARRDEPVANIDRSDPGVYDPFASRRTT